MARFGAGRAPSALKPSSVVTSAQGEAALSAAAVRLVSRHLPNSAVGLSVPPRRSENLIQRDQATGTAHERRSDSPAEGAIARGIEVLPRPQLLHR